MDSGTLRISIFLSVLSLMLLLELLLPRRKLNYPRKSRWSTNLLIIALDTAVVRIVLPITTIGIAQYAETAQWGVLNQVSLPTVVEIAIIILVFDLAIYIQHVLSHKIPILWRVHRVHHADLDFDTTTGIRFHPIEIVLSMVYKFILIILIGPSTLAILIFEIVLNSTALFNHANVKIPLRLDQILRWVLVTPDVHRIHHSVLINETNSNYGFNLTLWDRVFGTWTEQPHKNHRDMDIGLPAIRHKKPTEFIWSLMLPFRQ